MKWKNDAPYALCLSHDVDRTDKQWYHYGVYGMKRPAVQIRSLWEKVRGSEPYWNFEKIAALEEGFGVRSTFFFLNESHKELSANFMGRYDIRSPELRSIIKELDGRGFEIGLHGSFYSYSDEELLRAEKQTLEEIVGHEIVSTRQHHLNFDANRTWKIHAALGLRNDSTMGYAAKVGTEQPYRTREGLVEMPITLMDTVPLTEEVFQSCCEVAAAGGLVMLNFHQCHFNETEYPPNVAMYKRFLEKAAKDGAWMCSVREAGAWLDERL